MRHGVEFMEDDVAIFRLWAPSAEGVMLMLEDRKGMAMQRLEAGWHEIATPVSPGSCYRFLIDGKNAVPDPASRFQPEGVHGPSELANASYEWPQDNWKGRPWAEAVIYELHVGAFSPAGTYQGVEEKLDYLADLGVTAIELMPLAAFEGTRGWGYDGVLPFAPNAAYGRPEELKRLVASAHKRGLMMFLDVVYNHFGPSGNYLNDYAKLFFTDQYQTPWGAAIDFSQAPVREFFIQNALYWLEEFRFDGLRFDAVHAITDPSERHFLIELAETVRERSPQDRHVHLMLENDKNEARFLKRHYAAQWNDDIHHVLHVLLTGENGGYYADYAQRPLERLGRCLAQGFAYQGEPSAHRDGEVRGEPSAHLPPHAFIAFLQNHDQIGNRAMGDRLEMLISEEKLTLGLAILLLSPQIPLLFMGEEWAARQPFLYFCDFTGELADAVREGRRKEFASFAEFADLGLRERIPDPNAQATFRDSMLDWSEPELEPYHKRLMLARKLLALRKEHIVPLLARHCERSLFDLIEERGVEVRWQFEGGSTLRLIANFSDTPLDHGRAVEGEHVWGHFGEALPAWKCAFAIGKAA